MADQQPTVYMILEVAYGSYRAYACTRENAMKLFETFEPTHLPDFILETANEPEDVYWLSLNNLGRALKEVATLPIDSEAPNLRALLHGPGPKVRGQPVPELKDHRPETYVEHNHKAQLALVMMEHNLKPSDFDHLNLDTVNTAGLHDLGFLSPYRNRIAGKTAKYPEYPEYIDMAAEYKLIKKGQWKEGAAEEAIVRRILNFVNEHMTDRDTKYEVISAQQHV